MPEEWRVLGSETRLHDEWIHVQADRCVTADGHIVEPFYVLKYPEWVSVVAVTPDREIVLAREYRHGAGRVLTSPIAGSVEEGESPLDAAYRELREETGYSGSLLPLGSYWANPAMNTNRVWAFLATDAHEVADVKLDATEEIEVVRRPLAAFLQECWTGDADVQGLHLAAVFLALPHLAQQGLVTLPS